MQQSVDCNVDEMPPLLTGAAAQEPGLRSRRRLEGVSVGELGAAKCLWPNRGQCKAGASMLH